MIASFRRGVTIIAVLLAGSGLATAQTRIGAASLVENDVRAERSGGAVPLVTGGSVFRAETVATGAASSARLTFLDSTNLAIGPTSRIVLDEFVFSPNPGSQALTINLARGAFRFSTGSFDKNAYRIRTPTATIGVRGTVLDISAQASRTLVTLVDNGSALVCAGQSINCQPLTIPGQTLIVDRQGIRAATTRAQRFSFQQYCSGSPGLCAQTQFAETPGETQQAGFLPASLGSDPRPQGSDQPCGPQGCDILRGGALGLTGVGRYSDGSGNQVNFPFNTGLFPAPSQTEVLGNLGQSLSSSFTEGDVTITTSGSLTARPSSSPSGYQYTSWGEWAGNLQITVSTSSGTQSIALERGQYIYGTLTPADVMAGLRGNAIYSGYVRGDFINPSGVATADGVGGAVTLNADFTGRTVSGSMALTRSGAAWAAPVFASTPMSAGAGGGFQGQLTGPSGGSSSGFGFIDGAFAGPSAQEAMGTFTFFRSTGSSSDGLATGVYQARK